jgi:hypothetical protein
LGSDQNREGTTTSHRQHHTVPGKPAPAGPADSKAYLSAKSGGSKEKSTGPVTVPTSELDFEGEARALYRLYREDPKRLLLDDAATRTLIQRTYTSTPDEMHIPSIIMSAREMMAADDEELVRMGTSSERNA